MADYRLAMVSATSYSVKKTTCYGNHSSYTLSKAVTTDFLVESTELEWQ